MSAGYYVVECDGKRTTFGSVRDALAHAVARCSGGAHIYRVAPVAILTREELQQLRGLVGAVPRPESEEEARGGCVYVILDQMFRGFAGTIERELSDLCVELHEVVGRGLERTVRVSDKVFLEPARDDYDVLRLAERLAERGTVVLFTGDKKLAEQARMTGGVRVEYMPPGEFGGKEMAIKHMVRVIKDLARA